MCGVPVYILMHNLYRLACQQDLLYCATFVYVWRPSAGVPIGSVILQVFALLRCEGQVKGTD